MVNDNHYLWRGQHEANWNLTNSAQRYFDKLIIDKNQETYQSFIRSLVNYVYTWNRDTVNNYLAEQDRAVFDVVSIMTLMQHFKFPTPLLDFSTNPHIALFFCTSGKDYTQERELIENYSALYSLKKERLKNVKTDLEVLDHPYADQFKPLFETNLLLVTEDSETFRVAKSFNIINQTGVFIYSNDMETPLEKEVDLKANFECWHIHKSLNSEIRVRLKRSHRIDEEFVFPDLYKMIDDFHKGRE